MTAEQLLALTAKLDHARHEVREQTARDLLAADPRGEVLVPALLGELGASTQAIHRIERLVRHAVEHTGRDSEFLATVRARASSTLAELARHPDEFVRSSAVDVIGLLGPSEDERMLQAILAGLADDSEHVQRSACVAITWRWTTAAAAAVSHLIPLLRTANDEYACSALGAIGPAAEAAVPALRTRARRGDPSGRDHAQQALTRILGERARTSTPKAAAERSTATPAFELPSAEAPSVPAGTVEIGPMHALERTHTLGPGTVALAHTEGAGLVVTAINRQASLRRLPDGETLWSFDHDDTIEHVGFSPDDALIALVGADRLLVLRAGDGERLFVSGKDVRCRGAGYCVAPRFSRDGRWLAAVIQTGLRLWSRETGKAQDWRLPDVYAFDFAADDESLLVWSLRGIKRIELATGRELESHPVSGDRRFPWLFLGPAGRPLLVADGRKKREVQIEDALTGEPRHVVPAPTGAIHRSYALTRDGAYLLIIAEKEILVVRVRDGAPIGTITPAKVGKGPNRIHHASLGLGDRALALVDSGNRLNLGTLRFGAPITGKTPSDPSPGESGA